VKDDTIAVGASRFLQVAQVGNRFATCCIAHRRFLIGKNPVEIQLFGRAAEYNSAIQQVASVANLRYDRMCKN